MTRFEIPPLVIAKRCGQYADNSAESFTVNNKVQFTQTNFHSTFGLTVFQRQQKQKDFEVYFVGQFFRLDNSALRWTTTRLT